MANESIAAEPAAVPQTVDAPKLPEKDFFSGSKMLRFAEQSGYYKPDLETVKVPEKKSEPEKPCDDCPGGKNELARKASPPQEPKPQPTDQDKAISERERLLAEREKSLESLSGPMNKLLDMLEKEKSAGPTTPKPEPEQEDLDLDLVDPGVKKSLLTLKDENAKLKQSFAKFESIAQQAELEKAKAQIEETVVNVRKEHAFDDVVLESDQDFPRLSEDVYSGLVSVLVNRDRMAGKPLKPLQDYLKVAARGMSTLQGKYRGNGNGSEKLTSASVLEKYPDIAKEIGQSAIAQYLKDKEGQPSVARTNATEARERDSGKQDRSAWKGLDDAMKAAKNDPGTDAAFEEFSKFAPQH